MKNYFQKSTIWLGCWILICVFPISTTKSQTPDRTPQSKVDNLIEKEKKEIKNDTLFVSPTGATLPKAPNQFLLDELTRERYQAAVREYYEYHIFGHLHRREVFQWQLRSEKIIFFTVLGLVFCGIIFAAIQFVAGLKDKAQATVTPPSETATEISASMEGIKVSSPVLGIIILVISLLFFYLYLVYVYPIKEIF